MKRRDFVGACAAVGGAATLIDWRTVYAEDAPKLYARTRLIDIHGAAIRVRDLARDVNYVFQYPFAATPCFLLRLSQAPIAPPAAQLPANTTWPGGVGPDRALVAFSAICAHKLAYPTRDVSFIRYQRDPSATSNGHVIHCCADHSVYDPTRAARVIAGPAPQPLAATLLEYDGGRDELFALGTVGPEQFAAFFMKYEMKLQIDYGSTARARASVADTTIVRELTNYCRTTISC